MHYAGLTATLKRVSKLFSKFYLGIRTHRVSISLPQIEILFYFFGGGGVAENGELFFPLKRGFYS